MTSLKLDSGVIVVAPPASYEPGILKDKKRVVIIFSLSAINRHLFRSVPMVFYQNTKCYSLNLISQFSVD